MAASLASVAALFFTIIMHCCIGLNPRLNLIVNSLLLVLWALSWSLLTWYMSPTLRGLCDVENWHEDVGIMICRIYKALFTFALLGLYALYRSARFEWHKLTLTARVSTIAAVILDIYVRRQQNRRGVYRLHDLDVKSGPNASRGPFTEDGGYGQVGLAAPRESSAWEEPRPSMGPYSEQSEPMFENKGYAVPEDQFAYDTKYHVHGGQSVRPYGS